MRGDNELLLRIAFHQSPRDKWKEVAQIMSLSDGFRGKIISASASDPLATKTPLHRRIRNLSTQVRRLVEETGPHTRAATFAYRFRICPAKLKRRRPDRSRHPLDVDTRVTLHLPPARAWKSPPARSSTATTPPSLPATTPSPAPSPPSATSTSSIAGRREPRPRLRRLPPRRPNRPGPTPNPDPLRLPSRIHLRQTQPAKP